MKVRDMIEHDSRDAERDILSESERVICLIAKEHDEEKTNGVVCFFPVRYIYADCLQV